LNCAQLAIYFSSSASGQANKPITYNPGGHLFLAYNFLFVTLPPYNLAFFSTAVIFYE